MYTLSGYTVLPDISFRTNPRLKLFSITEKGILAIVNSLDPNKFYGRYNISIKMIKILWRIIDITLENDI